MPVYLDGNLENHDLPAGIVSLAGKSTNGHQGRAASCVNVGLINNMPDAALEATERQFIKLLEAAAGGVCVRLSLYALPDVPRRDWGRQRVKRLYSSLENLWSSQLDGLIVTGREPQTPNL